GHAHQSLEETRAALEVFEHRFVDPKSIGYVFYLYDVLATRAAELGDVKAALAAAAEPQRRMGDLRDSAVVGTPLYDIQQCRAADAQVDLALVTGELTTVRK